MNESLLKLYNDGLVSKEIILSNSDNKIELEQMLRGAFHGTGLGIDK